MSLDESGKYYLGFLYFNKEDKRVIVPKVNKMLGWTLNFARVQTYLIIALIVIVAIVSANLSK